MDILQTNDLKKNKVITYENDKFYYCRKTDLANLTVNDKPGEYRCLPLIRKGNKPCAMIGKYGYLNLTNNIKENTVLRPVLNYDELDISLIKNLKHSSVVTFTYGYYPQTLIDETLSEKLDRKIGKFKLTNKEYNFYINGELKTFPLYEYKGINFIIINLNNKNYFVEEKPLEFMNVPGDYDKIITVKGILSGVPCIIDGEYNKEFMEKFLNNILLNDITNNKEKNKQKIFKI